MTNNQIEKIEEYLSGEMTPEERKSFEQELEADTALAAAFHTYRDIETHMANTGKYTGEASLKSSLTQLGDEFFNIESKRSTDNSKNEESTLNKPTFSRTSTKRSFRLINIPIWQIAAAILFGIVAIGTWYIMTNKKSAKDQVVIVPVNPHDSASRPKNSLDTAVSLYPTPPNLVKQDTGSNFKPNIQPTVKSTNEQLFAEHFRPDAAPKDQAGPLEDAFEQYEKGNFTQAAAAFESADLNLPTRSEATDTLLTRFYVSYYKALSYIALKKGAKAIQLLKDLIGPNAYLQTKVQWYLALAYLRTGNKQEAIYLFQAISQNSEAGKYKLNANRLMMELKK